jgi:hypothetical protein
MKGECVHHVNGCRQAMRVEHDRSRRFPTLRIGQPGVEWWNKEERTLVRILGPKEGCVEDWDKVTCSNCLARKEVAEEKGPRWLVRNK